MLSNRADLLITDGLLVSGCGITRADVLVSEGKIREVADDLSCRSASNTIDASGKYILPGGIDAHAHPVHADKMDTFSVCAALGGVTTVIAFIGSEIFKHERYGNAWGLHNYNPDMVRGFIDEAREISYIDFAVHGLLTMHDHDDIERIVPELVRMGVISFKLFMLWNPLSKDKWSSNLAVPDEVLIKVMELAANEGGLTMVHAENGLCKGYLKDKLTAEGKVSRHHVLPAAPNVTESEAVYRAATMALITGSPLYPVHLSTQEILPIIDEFRSKGLTIYGETCPHYMVMTNEDLIEKGYLLKVSPPLRLEKDREAMWNGITRGTLNVIGSDFTGYTRQLKLTHYLDGDSEEPSLATENMFDYAAGLSTLEHMLPVVWARGVNTGQMTIPRFVEVFSENPAKIFGIYPQKGAIQPGSDADLVVWDPGQRHIVTEDHGVTDFSTFDGFELVGMPVLTISRGRVVAQNGQLVGNQGNAQYVAGDPNGAAYAREGPTVV